MALPAYEGRTTPGMEDSVSHLQNPDISSASWHSPSYDPSNDKYPVYTVSAAATSSSAKYAYYNTFSVYSFTSLE
ncbi:hypothetical protein ACVWYQ_002230 [Bradyrhizobium sp. USDA 3397]